MTLQITKPVLSIRGLLIGMYVRVPIDYPATQSYNYRIAQIFDLNLAANQAKVCIYQPDKPVQVRTYPIDVLNRCEILPDTPIIIISNRARGLVLLPVKDGWEPNSPKDYYVQLKGRAEILPLKETEFEVESHRQNPDTLDQLRRFEFYDPRLKAARDRVIEMYYPLRNSTPGLDDLVGSRVMLLPHQASVVTQVLNDPNCRYLLADEVGLGKTIEACVILKSLLRQQPGLRVLVIAPLSLVQQWYHELNTRFWLDFKVVGTIQEARTQLPQNNHFIIGIEDLNEEAGIWSKICSIKWDMVIADEVHQLGKINLLYQRIQKLSREARRLLLISATPIQHYANEYLKLMKLLDPDRYENETLENFRVTLNLQKKVRPALQKLERLISAEEIDPEEAEEELEKIIKDFPENQKLKKIFKTALEQIHDPMKVKSLAIEASVYLNENFRIETRVIRNRRKRVENMVTLPKRLLDVSYKYTPSERETITVERLHSYIDYYLAENGEDPFCLEYARLLLFAASSSPHAVLQLLEKRLAASRLSSILPRQRIETRLIPAQPRKEQDRIDYIVKLVPTYSNEVEHLEKLCELVLRWKIETEEALQAVCAQPALLARPGHHRLVQVLGILYKVSSVRTLLFSSWNQTIEFLVPYLNRLFNGQISEFSCRVSENALQEQANRFQRGNSKILICDELGGEGRNFQIADQIIHIDLPWTPAQIEQRIGRVDRIGRQGQVISFVPFARDTAEHELFRIWDEAFQLFTRSMSGMEIALEKVQLKLVKTLASPEGSKAGLKQALAPFVKEAGDIRKNIELELYQEEATDKRLQREFQNIIKRYEDGTIMRDALMGWVKTSSLPGNYFPATDTVRVKVDQFSAETMALHRFYNLAEVRETLRRAERIQGKANEFEGTFNRQRAVQREDLVFFVPGSDPWTEKIIAHALEADRGRCTGILRANTKLPRDFQVFEFLFSITVDPRPLYKLGYEMGQLAQVAGYLPLATKRVMITSNGEYVPENHPVWKTVVGRPFDPAQGDKSFRNTKEPQYYELLKKIYPLEKWETTLQQVVYRAIEKLEKEFANQSVTTQAARVELEQQAYRQNANATQKLNNSALLEAELHQRLITIALLEGLQKPYCRLESTCFWFLAKGQNK